MMENNILKRKLVNNGLLYTPIVVPDVLKDCLLILAHDKQGHNGFRRTYASLKNRFSLMWRPSLTPVDLRLRLRLHFLMIVVSETLNTLCKIQKSPVILRRPQKF